MTSETKETVTVTLDRKDAEILVAGSVTNEALSAAYGAADIRLVKAMRAALDQETKEPQQTTETAASRLREMAAAVAPDFDWVSFDLEEVAKELESGAASAAAWLRGDEAANVLAESLYLYMDDLEEAGWPAWNDLPPANKDAWLPGAQQHLKALADRLEDIR